MARWVFTENKLKAEDKEIISALSSKFSLRKEVMELLYNRGFKTEGEVDDLLNPKLNNLTSPFKIKDMEKALDIIIEALSSKCPIVVYSDYDVDGTVGAAVLKLFFRQLGREIEVIQPERLSEGYGLNEKRMREVSAAHANKKGLLITVDCGISNFNEIKIAKDNGLKVIIVDHHKVPENLPPADAIVDPQREDDDSGLKYLCGAGLAFYLAMALRSKLREMNWFTEGTPEPDLKKIMDIVAVATVCDIVPMVGDNRILVSKGLEMLNAKAGNSKSGILALCEIAGRSGNIDTQFIGYVIGPRINAAGRMSHASYALDLLTADERAPVKMMAEGLDQINRQRIALQEVVVSEARAKVLLEYGNIKSNPDIRMLFLASEGWHEGVLGIVASRMVEEFGIPVAVGSIRSDGTVKASVRGVAGVDMYQVLSSSGDLLINFGGHKAAGGFSVLKENLSKLKVKFNDSLKNVTPESRVEDTVDVDMILPIKSVDEFFAKELKTLAPFGVGFKEPKFVVKNVNLTGWQLIKGKHVKFWVESSKGKSIEAIWFNAIKPDTQTEIEDMMRDGGFDVLFALQINEMNGRAQLKVIDISFGY